MGLTTHRPASAGVRRVAIIGAGPAGLMAAERLASLGHDVTIFDQMPSPARKFLLAGRGGLNITHSEALEKFWSRYGAAASWMSAAIDLFPPARLMEWCEGLGQELFTGSSGRVFPVGMKAAPLLRAWLRRLGGLGVRLEVKHRWTGWDADGALSFDAPAGRLSVAADAVVLALGGASWPRMGADGHWVAILRERCVAVSPLRASNCGVRVAWSEIFANRFEGLPLKRIAVSVAGQTVRGEAVITHDGLEGGAIYALAAPIRAALDAEGQAMLQIDLRPDIDIAKLGYGMVGNRSRSLPNYLRQTAHLSPPAIGLVQEALHNGEPRTRLLQLVKGVPVRVVGTQPLARAISTAGGVGLDELDEHLMLRRLPGVFLAGEMLDWDAPTGGYLLQGCFSTGVLAALGVARFLGEEGRHFF